MAELFPYDNRTRDLLAAPPAPGQGRHEWLFRVQARLLRARLAPDTINARLAAALHAVGWGDRAGELEKNMDKLTRTPPPDTTPAARRPTWPTPDHAQRARLQATTAPAFDPTPAAAPRIPTAEILHGLYGDSRALLCVASSVRAAHCYRLAEIAPAAARFEFIVANPMRADFGTTQTGQRSARAHSNACTERDRRFLVVEFDQGEPLAAQAAVLTALSTPAAPLALAVFSGGKSIHGWFRVRGLAPTHIRRLFWRAVYLGADASLWDLAKLVRMPGGRRANGADQPVLYWEPEHAA